MKFKFQKILTDKQVFRAKWSLASGCILGVLIYANDCIVKAQDETLMYNDEEWLSTKTADFE